MSLATKILKFLVSLGGILRQFFNKIFEISLQKSVQDSCFFKTLEVITFYNSRINYRTKKYHIIEKLQYLHVKLKFGKF